MNEAVAGHANRNEVELYEDYAITTQQWLVMGFDHYYSISPQKVASVWNDFAILTAEAAFSTSTSSSS